MLVSLLPGGAQSVGLRTGTWLHFTFTGTPAGAIDIGGVIIEPTHAFAVKAAKQVYEFSYAYELKHTNGVTPKLLKVELAETIHAVGNAVEVWTTTPVSAAARRVVAACVA